MNGRASQIILWLGLAMITAQVVKDWATIRQSLFQGGGSSNNTGGIPILPFPIGIPGEGGGGSEPPPENPPPAEPPPEEPPPPEVPLIVHRTMT